MFVDVTYPLMVKVLTGSPKGSPGCPVDLLVALGDLLFYTLIQYMFTQHVSRKYLFLMRRDLQFILNKITISKTKDPRELPVLQGQPLTMTTPSWVCSFMLENHPHPLLQQLATNITNCTMSAGKCSQLFMHHRPRLLQVPTWWLCDCQGV